MSKDDNKNALNTESDNYNDILAQNSEKCKNDLKNSGISDETIKSYKDYFKVSSDSWKLYYPEISENVPSDYHTSRFYGKTKGKYKRSKGKPSRFFRPLAFDPKILNDTNIPIVICEGEKKSIKAQQEGINCLGIAGVYCWKCYPTPPDDPPRPAYVAPPPDEEVEANSESDEESDTPEYDIIPDFEKIKWKNRIVYICYDNDFRQKEQVKKGLYQLAALLIGKYGAKVKMILLPESEEKIGLDDYLLTHTVEEYRELEKQAPELTLKSIQNALTGMSELGNPFPIDVFSEDIQKFIIDTSHRIDGSMDYIASGILGGASALMNGIYRICVNPAADWYEEAILWLNHVGLPSNKKTPCLRIPKSIVDEFDNEFSKKFDNDMEKYKLELAEYTRAKKSKSDEDILPPEPPVRQRITMQNATIEALSTAVSYNDKGCKRGITIWVDELAGFYKGLGQYKSSKDNNDEEYMLQSWSKQRYNYMRKSNNTDVVIYPAHSIIGTMQPKVLNDTILSSGLICSNGQLERWLFTTTDYVETGKPFSDNTPFDKSVLREVYRRLFTRQTVKCYKFNPQAQERFNKFYYDITQRKKDRKMPDFMQSYLQKQTNYVARFALILHCMNDPEPFEIEEETVIKAIRLSDYFVKSFERIALTKALTIDLVQETLNKLLISKRKSISPTQLYKRNTSKYRDKDRALIILEHLQDMAYGRLVKSGSGVTFKFY